MINNTNNLSKAIYTKPTLIEYGSLAERTKMFGLPEPHPDLVTLVLTTISIGTSAFVDTTPIS
jgi:hypothetical protein